MQAPTGELHLQIYIIDRILLHLLHVTYTNYRAYTSVLHTKQLLYYSRHSILTVKHYANFDWWATVCTSQNMHHECFRTQNFVHTSGEHLHCVTNISINMGRSFHIRVRAFRLTACIIRLTILLHCITFGCRPREEACMRHHEKSERTCTCSYCGVQVFQPSRDN